VSVAEVLPPLHARFDVLVVSLLPDEVGAIAPVSLLLDEVAAGAIVFVILLLGVVDEAVVQADKATTQIATIMLKTVFLFISFLHF